MVNGKPAKASVKVKIGDVIEIQFGTKTVKVEVLDLQDTTKKKKRKICSAIYKLHSVSVHREIRSKGKYALMGFALRRPFSPCTPTPEIT